MCRILQILGQLLMYTGQGDMRLYRLPQEAENCKFHIHPQNLKLLACCWGILYSRHGQGLLCGWTFVCSSLCAVLQEEVRNIGPWAWGGVGNVDEGFYLWLDRTRAGEQLQVSPSCADDAKAAGRHVLRSVGGQAFICDGNAPILCLWSGILSYDSCGAV